MTIDLLPTEDILAEVVRRRRPGQLLVGFAAETENRLENGRAKLLRKGVDAIVVNDVSREGVGFDSDLNGATFLTATTAIDLPEMSKRKLADRILDEVVGLRRPQSLLVELSGMELSGESVQSQESVLADSDFEIPAVSSRRQIMIEE
jgi:phosphopantothenoylcysteine decarboxylase/phosphopantothenate--cysteine ligase